MSFQVYRKYKDSGIETLGPIPDHWRVCRLRYCVQLNPSKSELSNFDRTTEVSFLPMEAIGDDGSLDLERRKPLGEVEFGYTYFRDGDVVVAKITPCFENGKGAVMNRLCGGIGFGTTELIVARPILGKILPEYLHALFQSTAFRADGQSYMYGAGGQKRVPDNFVRDFQTALPPIEEQQSILRFLTEESGKIDVLVAEQQRLIELLKEERQAVISHAVTKGLNPYAPMKPSGVEWLGEVPEHWTVTTVRYACQIDNNLRFPIDKQTRMDLEGNYPYYGPTGILSWISEYRIDGEYFLIGEDGDHFLKFEKQPMTILVNGKFNVNNHAHLVRGRGECSTAWACRYFEHKDLLPWLIKQGVGRYKLRKELLQTIPLVVPPRSEQNEILTRLDKISSTTRHLTAEIERATKLLQERRTAIISPAFTGKIDVRGYGLSDAGPHKIAAKVGCA